MHRSIEALLADAAESGHTLAEVVLAKEAAESGRDPADIRARVQRMHQLEERELFPACDASIPADDQLGFCERFAELERERGGVAEWRARVRALARTWLG